MNPYTVLFELLAYGLFLGCLWDARRQGIFFIVELLWTGLYGFLLEWLSIKQLHAYHYGNALFQRHAVTASGTPRAGRINGTQH